MGGQRIKGLLCRLNMRDGANNYEPIGEEIFREMCNEDHVKKIVRMIKKHGSGTQCNAINVAMLLHALSPLLANAMDDDDQSEKESWLLEILYEVLAWIVVFREQWPSLFGAIILLLGSLMLVIGWRGMCMRAQRVRLLHGCGDREGNLNVRVNIDVNHGFNQNLNAGARNSGNAVPGTPFMPIDCATESDNDEMLLWEQAAKRGAKSKRKSKPSPRHDDDAEVIDGHRSHGDHNDARGSADGEPLRRPVVPDEDGWHRHRPGKKVWIATQHGKKFHRLGCGKMYCANEAEEVDRIQALAKGFSQCRICKP